MSETVAARFAGLWSVTREITDRGEGPSGRFRGLARISREPQGLRYAEQGWLRLGAQRMQASRVHLWRPLGDSTVQVLFEDGRPFHAFDFARAESRAEHLCGADRYALRYSFGRDAWHLHCEVSGPRKDYASTTRYLRAAPGDAALAGGEGGA